jgi:hypothetical protein
MSLRSDRAGVEGIPLQLLIIVIILGISLPVVFATWTTVDAASTDGRIQAEIERLATEVGQAYSYGPGTGLRVNRVDFSSGTFTAVEYVKLGDAPTKSTAALIRFKISGQGERTVILPGEVPLTSVENTTFSVGPGVYDFLLRTVRTEGGDVYVVISLAP